MADDKRISKGIDGWLLVFLILCVGLSLYYLFAFASALRFEDAMQRRYGETPPWSIRIEGWMLWCARIAIPLVVVWRMVVARRRATIRLAVGLIWLLLVGLTSIDLAFAMLLFGADPLFFRHLGLSFGPGLAGAALATAYLLGSKRVAATYPRDGSVDGVFD